MLESVRLFDAASARMQHATKRHDLITNNIAHADTPNYKGRDLIAFQLEDPSIRMEATRADHLNYDEKTTPFSHNKEQLSVTAFDETINRNKVTIEDEMVKAAESIGSHNFAASIWEKSLSMLETVITGGRR